MASQIARRKNQIEQQQRQQLTSPTFSQYPPRGQVFSQNNRNHYQQQVQPQLQQPQLQQPQNKTAPVKSIQGNSSFIPHYSSTPQQFSNQNINPTNKIIPDINESQIKYGANMSIQNAITLLSLRMGKAENIIMHLQNTSSINDNGESSMINNNDIFNSINERLQNLENINSTSLKSSNSALQELTSNFKKMEEELQSLKEEIQFNKTILPEQLLNINSNILFQAGDTEDSISDLDGENIVYPANTNLEVSSVDV